MRLYLPPTYLHVRELTRLAKDRERLSPNYAFLTIGFLTLSLWAGLLLLVYGMIR